MSDPVLPPPPTNDERSTILGMSVRAFLAILIIGTFCAVALMRAVVPIVQLIQGIPTSIDIPQELNNLAIATAGFYLGQKYQEK